MKAIKLSKSCLAQKGRQILTKLINVEKIGSPTIENYVASGFSTSNYLKIIDDVPFATATSFDITLCFTPKTIGIGNIFRDTSGNYTSGIYLSSSNNLQVAFNSSSGDSYFINYTSTEVFNVGTKYWVKVNYDGTTYNVKYSTDGLSYTTIYSKASTAKLLTRGYTLGTSTQSKYQYPFGGFIYLDECYININGQRWWSGYKDIIGTTYKICG